MEESGLHYRDVYLDVSILYTGPELYMDKSWTCLHYITIEACAPPGLVYNTEPKLHQNVSPLQRPVLHPGLSIPQGPEQLDLFWTTEACASPGPVYTAGA
jgi:hypothetical protein